MESEKNIEDLKKRISDLEYTNRSLLSENSSLKEDLNYTLKMIKKIEDSYNILFLTKGEKLDNLHGYESIIRYKIEKLEEQLKTRIDRLKILGDESDSNENKSIDFNDYYVNDFLMDQLLFNIDFIPKLNNIEDYDFTKSKEENYLDLVGLNYKKKEEFDKVEILKKVRELKSLILITLDGDDLCDISELLVSNIENLLLIGNAGLRYVGNGEYDDVGTEYDSEIHDFIVTKSKLKKLIIYKIRFKTSNEFVSSSLRELKNLDYFFVDVRSSGSNNLDEILFNISFNNDLKTLIVKTDGSIDVNNIILFPNLEKLELEVLPSFDPGYFSFSDRLKYLKIIFNDYLIKYYNTILDIDKNILLRSENKDFRYHHDYNEDFDSYWDEDEDTYNDDDLWFEKYSGRLTVGEARELETLLKKGVSNIKYVKLYKKLRLNLIKHLKEWKKKISKRNGYLYVEIKRNENSYLKFERNYINELSIENWPYINLETKEQIIYNIAFSTKQFDTEDIYHLPIEEIRKEILGDEPINIANNNLDKIIVDFNSVRSLVISSDFNYDLISNDYHNNIKSVFIYKGNKSSVILQIGKFQKDIKYYFSNSSNSNNRRLNISIVANNHYRTTLKQITLYKGVRIKVSGVESINCLIFNKYSSETNFSYINFLLKGLKNIRINDLRIQHSLFILGLGLKKHHQELISLTLDSNEYKEVDPFIGIKELNNIKNLTIINNKENLHFVEEMKSLHSFNLVGNDKPLPDLSDLTNLYQLKLIDNFQDLNPISNINNLIDLDLTGNISDLVTLKDKIISIKSSGGEVIGIPDSKLFEFQYEDFDKDKEWWDTLSDLWKKLFVFNIELNDRKLFDKTLFVNGFSNYENIIGGQFPELDSLEIKSTLLRIKNLKTYYLVNDDEGFNYKFDFVKDFTPLTKLNDLNKLVISWFGQELKILSSLKKLSHIEIVIPNSRRRSELFNNDSNFLIDLPNIRTLKIYNNFHLYDLSKISYLVNLKELHLINNMSFFPSFDKLNNLEVFSVNPHGIFDFLENERVRPYSSFGDVYISKSGLEYFMQKDRFNDYNNRMDLDSISSLKKLKVLDLTNNKTQLTSLIDLKNQIENSGGEVIGWDERLIYSEAWWNMLSGEWKDLLLFNIHVNKKNISLEVEIGNSLFRAYEKVTSHKYKPFEEYNISEIIKEIKSFNTLYIENINRSNSFENETIYLINYFHTIENLIICNLDVEIDQLANFTNLKGLYFYGELEKIAGIGELSKLEKLYLKNYSGDKEEISKLKNLKELGVVGKGDFDFLRKIGNLDLLILFSVAGTPHRGNYPLIRNFEKIDTIKKLSIYTASGRFFWTGNQELDLFKYIDNLDSFEIIGLDPDDTSALNYNMLLGLYELKIMFEGKSRSWLTNYSDDKNFKNIFNISNLNKLIIHSNHFDITDIKQLSKLKYLDLTNCNVEIKELDLPESIETLILDKYNKELPVFKPHNSIKHLNINSYSGSLENLKTLNELEELSVNTLVTLNELEIIKYLPKIKRVKVYNNVIDITGLLDDSNIEEVTITNNYYCFTESIFLNNTIVINNDVTKKYKTEADIYWWNNLSNKWKDIIVFNYQLSKNADNFEIETNKSFLCNYRNITSKEFMYESISDNIKINEVINSIDKLYIDEYLSINITSLEPLCKFKSLKSLIIKNNTSELLPLVSLSKLTDLTLINNNADISILPSLAYITKLGLYDYEGELEILGSLNKLNELSLKFTDYNDASRNLDVIKNLKDLTSLTLNNYTGKFEFLNHTPSLIKLNIDLYEDLSQIKSVPKLKELILNIKKETNLELIKSIVGLEKLIIYDYNNSNKELDTVFLQGLNNLKTLKIRSYRILNFTPISGLNGLVDLKLSKVSDIDNISNLVNLENLSLINLISEPKEIFNLKKLKSLDLSWCEHPIKGLHLLGNLEYLNVCGCDVNFEEEIYKLSRLNKLDICEEQIKWYGVLFDDYFEEDPSIIIPNILNVSLDSNIHNLEYEFTSMLNNIKIIYDYWEVDTITNFEDYYNIKKELNNPIITLPLDEHDSIYEELKKNDCIHCWIDFESNTTMADQMRMSDKFDDKIKYLVWLEHTVNTINYTEHYQEKEDYDNDGNSYGRSYGKYSGSYAQDVAGYSDDVIDDAFDGDPEAYWNID